MFGPDGHRGLALVTVLWVLVLLALMAASFTRTTRTEISLARILIHNAKALADAGMLPWARYGAAVRWAGWVVVLYPKVVVVCHGGSHWVSR
jgi:type II secretory pathway component PulK